MKKFSIKAVALAAGVLAGGSAFAQVNLNATPVVPVKFASELTISGAGTPLTNAASALNVQVQAGVTVAAATTRYVRFDLSSGVFTANPTLSILTSGGTGAATLNGTLTSGGTGSSFAVFSVTTANGGTAGDNIASTNQFTLVTTTGITATSQADITARYRIFSIPAFADAPTESNFLFGKSGTLLTFTEAVSFVAADNAAAVTATYSAPTSFAEFKSGSSTTKTAALGTLTPSINAGVAGADGVAIAAVSTVYADETIVTVNGDFSFLKKTGTPAALDKAQITFDGEAAQSVTATKAVFGKTGAGVGDNTGVSTLNIVEVDGTVGIPAGSYTADIAWKGQTGFQNKSLNGQAIGKIVRDGTTLVAPLVNQPAGWYSRLVLTNSGNTDLAYRVAATQEGGNTVALTGDAASGTVAKNSTKVINLDTLATITGGVRAGLVVTVDGADTAITGLYQLANGATSNVSSYPLVLKK